LLSWEFIRVETERKEMKILAAGSQNGKVILARALRRTTRSQSYLLKICHKPSKRRSSLYRNNWTIKSPIVH
jgi:hypothetical protein